MRARMPVAARILAGIRFSPLALIAPANVASLANANPMTHTGPRSGRPFVVVAASGHINLQSTPLSDTFVAFALPETKQ